MDDLDDWWDDDPEEWALIDDEPDVYQPEGPWDAGYRYGALEDDYSENSSP